MRWRLALLEILALAVGGIIGCLAACLHVYVECVQTERCHSEAMAFGRSLGNLSYSTWGECNADNDCVDVPIDVPCMSPTVVTARKGAEMDARSAAAKLVEDECKRREQSGCQGLWDLIDLSVGCVSGQCRSR